LGPQTLFYLPEGLLNHNGKNTLAIGVIAVDKEVTLGKVTLEPYGKLLSSKPTVGMVESPSYIELKSI
jgi:beta-galactosidase